MTQQATERSAEVFWARAIGGTVLGIIIGTFNRAIVADLLATRMFGQFLGFGVGGLVAGAIQGAFLRRHIHSRWMWIALSSTGWLMLGIPEVWFPPNSLWYWACNHLVRYALLG